MKINKVLVANRGEIAIRIFRACVELGIETVGIYTYEDRYSQHRWKADESYQIGDDDQPLKPYLDMEAIIHLAKSKNVDAIHPGYGFLSENAHFASRCIEEGILWIGPSPMAMQKLGDKVSAKEVAVAQNVPVIESSTVPLSSVAIAIKEANRIGYPIMLKAAAGGGGRGMRIIRTKSEVEKAFPEAKREAATAFGNDTLFIEKFVENPKHIEIQIVGDNHGNMVHMFERDCSVQRRFQKVVEVAPAFGLDQKIKDKLYDYAIKICRAVEYNNVGTVEFLVDQKGKIFFIEVNPRIQVEHTITELVTGIDLIKTQLFVASGHKLSEKSGVYSQDSVQIRGCAIQCRITTEDPENNFQPDYGVITTYRHAAGFGIRLDSGSLYQGVKVSPFFDSLLVKVSAQSRTLDGATRRMSRALREMRIRGVKTNIPFLYNIMNNETFKAGEARVGFVNDYPELFDFPETQDRASKMVKYLGEVVVNGNPDVKVIDLKKNDQLVLSKVPSFDPYLPYPKGTKDLLNELGPEAFCAWLKKENKIHYTDTTMRDAHQSLLATRMRSFDLLRVAESFARNHAGVFSMEVWGGATFDVCLRFLHENPWARLSEIRKAVPNILLQMLLRGSNAVGYKAYPDNLVEEFIVEAHQTGIDIFRIFDSLNWLKAMETSIKTVREKTGAIAEVALCYTGDILDKSKSKYDLKYYVQLAKDIENSGAHILAIKDMAGLLKPYAATELIGALKDNIAIPIHLHTHDTSSLQPATYLKAIEAGVDVVDVALGGLSGLTSQPNFNSILEMMRFQERENAFDADRLNEFSVYWENTREFYYPFESGLKASTAEVFKHEIPGGQYSNLKPQAIALGLGDRFEEIKQKYQEVNQAFGDLVKVTPSSKVVGDMAQYMVGNNLEVKDLLEKGDEISFPDSVQSFFIGDLGQPYKGFPKKLQALILKNKKPYTDKPNKHLTPIDFDVDFPAFKKKYQKGFGREIVKSDFLSYQLYPKVWEEAYSKHLQFGDISRIPSKNFFFGMKEGEETIIEIAPGKTIIVKLLSVGPANVEGRRIVFFKVNGQTRNVEITDRSLNVEIIENEKIQKDNAKQIGAPLQGLLSKIMVKKGQPVKKNSPLFVIEAMKMETTITASENSVIDRLILKEGSMVNTDDLVMELA